MNSMKHFGIIILLVFNISLVYAQIDSDYIQEYPQKFDITVSAGWDLINVIEKNTNYRPNNPVKLGLNFSVNDPNFSIGGSINITDKANQDLPRTTSYDFQIHSYSNKFMFDVYLQNYKGFYTGELPDISSFPDMSLMKIGVEAMYIFNNNRFSARAAFAQTEKQLKPAGSFLLGAGSYLFLLERDSLDSDYLQLGASLGYAYIFVFPHNLFASAAMTGGVYYYNQLNSDNDPSASFNGVARASFGYNTDNWCVSVRVIYTLHFFNNDLLFSTGNFQMAFTYRFDGLFK